MSPDEARDLELDELIPLTLSALGVTAESPDAVCIMEHAIAQASIELEILEKSLERELQHSLLIYVLTGIRKRLELAGEGASTLARLLLLAKSSEAANG